MQAIARNDGGVLVPLFANLISTGSTSIEPGEQIAAHFSSDGWNCIEP